MTDPKPKLVAVGSAPSASESQPAQQKRRRWTDLGPWFWIAVLILIVAVAYIAAQRRQLDQLTAQVESLETELEAAEGALQGYESRFGEIRASVGDLRTQLDQLEGLVKRPPPTAPPR